VLDGLCGIPAAVFRTGQFVQKRYLVISRQLCKHLLHKFRVGLRASKSAHVFEVAWGKPF
jgi:hypothetical protein